MKKILSKILFVTALLSTPFISFAQVSKIVFTTEEQSVKPNVVSGVITIQLQNSSDQPESAGETADLFVESSSPTGEFSSSDTNWQSVEKMTVNSNWSNRSFYYKDSSLGAHTISASLIGRTSFKEWTASQKITISSPGSPSNTSDAGGEVLSANTESLPSANQSATSGAVAPSYATTASQLEVSAGGDRLTSPGSPISFQALIKKNSVANSAVSFSWAFGDGNVGTGALVTHMYKYPGEYAVVLNAKTGNTFAIARLKVKVVETKFIVSEKDNYIEILNNTNSEINLFNWKIVCGALGFIFQPDTIIFPNSSMKIDKSLLQMKGEPEEEVVLKNYNGEIVASSPKIITSRESKEISMKMDKVWRETASVLDKALALNLVKESAPKPVQKIIPSDPGNTGEVAGESVEYRQMLEEGSTTEPLGEVIYESPVKETFVQRIIEFITELFD